MKKIILTINCIFIVLIISAQNVFMYDRTGEKTFLQKVDTVQFVHFDNFLDTLQEKILNQSMAVLATKTEKMLPSIYKLTTNPKQQKSLQSALNQKDILYASTMLLSEQGDVCWESENIFVTIFPDSDLPAILIKNNRNN